MDKFDVIKSIFRKLLLFKWHWGKKSKETTTKREKYLQAICLIKV